MKIIGANAIPCNIKDIKNATINSHLNRTSSGKNQSKSNNLSLDGWSDFFRLWQ